MTDVDDTSPTGAHVVDLFEYTLGFLSAERCRRLVENDEGGASNDRASDFDLLLDRGGHAGDRTTRIDPDPEFTQHHAGLLIHRGVVERTATGRHPSEEDVFGDGEFGDHLDLLMDD